MGPSLTIKSETQADRRVFTLSGVINEHATVELAPLLSEPAHKCTFNFRGVHTINSSGIRCWLLFLRDFQPTRAVQFEAVSVVMMMQINMIPSAIGNGILHSLYVPYRCPACDHDQEVLLTGPTFPTANSEAPAVACEACKKPSAVSEDDDFFAFNRR